MSANIDLSFSHDWQAAILSARPLILPSRHFTYPREAEEVERGALEVLIQPQMGSDSKAGPTPDTSPQFLATCALGFRDPAVPTGLWSTPNPKTICAICGGYAYLIDTTAPEQFTMLPYRPVLEVHPAPAENLLLFAGHRSILAWGASGQAWESEKLSDEGITISAIQNGTLRGTGWHLLTDKEVPFVLDLSTGSKLK